MLYAPGVIVIPTGFTLTDFVVVFLVKTASIHILHFLADVKDPSPLKLTLVRHHFGTLAPASAPSTAIAM